jgi:hypothetical protein
MTETMPPINAPVQIMGISTVTKVIIKIPMRINPKTTSPAPAIPTPKKRLQPFYLYNFWDSGIQQCMFYPEIG